MPKKGFILKKVMYYIIVLLDFEHDKRASQFLAKKSSFDSSHVKKAPFY